MLQVRSVINLDNRVNFRIAIFPVDLCSYSAVE